MQERVQKRQRAEAHFYILFHLILITTQRRDLLISVLKLENRGLKMFTNSLTIVQLVRVRGSGVHLP